MSKLRVNDVIPANGLNIGIGTAGGNFIVGGASTTVVVNGDIDITGNVTGSSGATFTNITVGANNGFHVDGGAPASSLTVNNLGNTVVGSGHSVYIADGNLVFQTTGTGIDFSGDGIASTSATSSILDDYEEGTWTPAISNTGYSYTYSVQEGQYTKIGRLVTLRFRIVVTARSGSSSGGHAIINLPITSDGALDGSSYAYAMPSELIVHKTSTTTTSGAKTLLFGGVSHNNTSNFWVNNPTTSQTTPFDLGSDFNLGGVITYTA